MIADFVMSMSRKVEDKVSKTARFHIIKNRFGVDGITFPSKMDTELGKIDIYKIHFKTRRSTAKENG